MKKKVLSIGLCLIICSSLAGCVKKAKSDYNDNNSIETNDKKSTHDGGKVVREEFSLKSATVGGTNVVIKAPTETTTGSSDANKTPENTTGNTTETTNGTIDNNAAVNNGNPAVDSTTSNVSNIDTSQLSGLNGNRYKWATWKNSSHTTPGLDGTMKSWAGKYNATYIGDTSSKVVYLTFNADGDKGDASTILDTLKKHSIKATIFTTKSYISSNQDIVKRLAKEGHTVANYTSTKTSMYNMSADQIKNELVGAEEEYKKVTGQNMVKCVRPPSGEFSEKSLYLTNSLGYKTIFWSFSYNDYWEGEQYAPYALSLIKDNSHNGEIAFFHLGSKTDAQILDDAIKYFKSQGYSFRTF